MVDLIIGIVVLVSVGIAFFRGFIREVLTIFGVVGGFLAAVFLSPLLAPLVRSLFGDPAEDGELFGLIPYDVAASTIAYSLVFITVVIILSLFSHWLSGRAKKVGLGAVDRTLGIFFGLGRGVLLIGLVYALAMIFIEADTRKETLGSSVSYPYLEMTGQFLTGFFPDSLKDQIEEKVEDNSGLVDTLKNIQDQKTDQSPPNKKEDKQNETSNGYSDEQRQEIEKLIIEEIQNPNQSGLNE